jgi:hypothetical protein
MSSTAIHSIVRSSDVTAFCSHAGRRSDTCTLGVILATRTIPTGATISSAHRIGVRTCVSSRMPVASRSIVSAVDTMLIETTSWSSHAPIPATWRALVGSRPPTR